MGSGAAKDHGGFGLKKAGKKIRKGTTIWCGDQVAQNAETFITRANEQNYQEQEAQKSRASITISTPPGSVACLLSDGVERSPSLDGNSGVGSRARGRPRGVKDSRPRKRRCENERAVSVEDPK